jgi:uncharacterized protein (TIGR03435 family)
MIQVSVRRRMMQKFLVLLAVLSCSVAACAQKPAFDVASVKVNPSSGGRSHIWSVANEGSFKTQNVSLKGLLQFAYGLPETQVLGVPATIADKTFDIEAKVDDAAEAAIHALSTDEGKLRKQQMVQSLLALRFKLVCHMETRELPIYALVVTKDGPKLTPAKSDGLTVSGFYGKLTAEGLTLDGLARELAKSVGRVVVDKTAISGRFDINLTWTPDEGPARLNGVPIADPPPAIFTAIQEQLGLKLEPQRGPVQVVVIDHVEMPTSN